MIYLGNFNNKKCTIANSAINNSLLLTGASGSGKTSRMQRIELDAAHFGATVVVLDTSHSHDPDQIYAPIRSEYESVTNRLSATDTGIELHIFGNSFNEERFQSLIINSATQMLANSAGLKQRQTQLLRKAVSNAYINYTPKENEVQCIKRELLKLGTHGEELCNRLWYLFECDSIHPCNYHLQSGYINLIDISNFNSETQKIVTELFLRDLWNACKSQTDQKLTYYICLDECQNLYLGADSIICRLLREGRKFGMNLLLATQSLCLFPASTKSMLQQTGTQLYFRPSPTDMQHISRMLKQAYAADYQQTLSQLYVGESLATGFIQIGNTLIQRPIKLT